MAGMIDIVSELPPAVGPRTVVLADDDDAVRVALVELFDDVSSLVVVGAGADADAAIALCRANRPDVLVVDVNMPAGGGERATRVIHRELPGIVVVALSANADRVTRRRMAEAGADAFVPKGDSDNLVLVVTTAGKASS